MKLLPAAFAALVLGTAAPALAQSLAPQGPGTPQGVQPSTSTALACRLGLGPGGCESAFENPAAANRGPGFCSGQYVRREADNCPSGPLETVQYLGTNAAGADVYDVRYMNAETTYVLPAPNPDGKVAGLWFFDDPPMRVLHHDLVTVTAAAAPKILYSRPQDQTG